MAGLDVPDAPPFAGPLLRFFADDPSGNDSEEILVTYHTLPLQVILNQFGWRDRTASLDPLCVPRPTWLSRTLATLRTEIRSSLYNSGKVEIFSKNFHFPPSPGIWITCKVF